MFAMQVAEAPPGEKIHDIMVYDMMRRKRPDASAPPDAAPQYYGNAGEHIESYCQIVQSRHPEVDDPRRAETNEESLVLSGHGLQHGHLKVLNTKVKHSLTTSITHLKAVLTPDSAPIPPRDQPRRPKYDVSFPHFHPLCDFRSCMAKC
jgi:hypothetical protein